MERNVRRLWERLQINRLTVIAALLISYPLLFVAAVLPTGTHDRLPACWLFLAAAVISYLAEAVGPRVALYMVNLLNWLQVGITLRFAFREVALIVLLARVLHVGALQFAAFTLGLMALHGVRAVYSSLVIYVSQRRRLPVVTRNVDLGDLRIPDAPPRLLVANHTRTMLHLDVLALAGGLAAAFTTNFVWALTGISLALMVGVLASAIMVPHARRNAHLGDKGRIVAAVRARVREYRPEVMLYFSGSSDAVYQLNMWLSTLARLNRPAVIIMRERAVVPLVSQTSLPVVCIDSAIDLMNCSLPSVRVALFPANTGKNIHQLRISGVAHVFIGHGDSDKTASFNPYTKVYDQVWVAGKAGRDRYLRAQVGVRDEDIVEVGRPQLAEIRPGAGDRADPILTVLYAPTWEGWIGDDPYQTSLVSMGLRIIRALTEEVRGIRVLYKPHPLTGTRDRRATDAHDSIVAAIEEANLRREASGGYAGEARASEAVRAAAATEMASIEARLDKLTGGQRIATASAGHQGPDDATLSRDSRPDTAGEAEHRRLNDAWQDVYWGSEGWWRHRVITGPLPTLYECFNRSDVLISDISSVVADFIATGKPYVVTNPAGLDDAEFCERFPTAAAAYLLGADCAELPDICEQAARAGDDRLAQARRELKHYLLGPDSPDAQTRFSHAVEALVRCADRSATELDSAGPPVIGGVNRAAGAEPVAAAVADEKPVPRAQVVAEGGAMPKVERATDLHAASRASGLTGPAEGTFLPRS
jgi:hypothetical protein